MRAIIGDRSRPWHAAVRSFEPDPPSMLAMALFWRQCYLRLGLSRAEAEIAYYHCCGYTANAQIAALRNCAAHTIKNLKSGLFRRLDIHGNYQTTALVMRLWPLYVAARRAAEMTLTYQEDNDAARLVAPGTADAGADAAVHRGGAGALPGVWASADEGAGRRD